MMDNTWTEERVELLKKLWADGLSASQIAGEIGGVTRNAVIGKVHRLGLSGRAKAPAAASAVRQAAPRKTASSGGGHRTVARTPPSTPPRPVVEFPVEAEISDAVSEDVLVPFSERVTIMELKEGMCRWPMGDPTKAEFRFCGGKCAIGTPYCTHHARIAYQPAADRRRERDRERRAAARL